MSQFSIKPCQHGRAKFVVDGTVNGRRSRQFFRTKGEAQAYAEARNIEIKNHGQELASMSNLLRSEALVANERLAPLGVSITQAVEFYLAHHDWSQKSVTVKTAWTACEEEFKRRVVANEISWAHMDTTCRAGTKLVRAFGDELVCSLSGQQLREWMTSLPIGTVTRNNVRLNLSGFFTFCKERGWIKDNPIADIRTWNDQRIKTKPPGIYTPEQAAALLSHATREMLPYFAIGLFGGLRVAELKRLDWSDIDFEAKLINVRAENAKTAQPRWVTMTDHLIEWLLPYRQARGPVVPVRGAKKQAYRIRLAAGIPISRDLGNALRHSFCSYHLALHENSALTAKEAGHMGTDMLYRQYNRRVKKTLAQTYFSIKPTFADNILAAA